MLFPFFLLYQSIWFVCLLAPLQPFTINGRDQRNRILANGPIVHHQLPSSLPTAASLQSLSPLVTTNNSIGNVLSTNLEQQSDHEEKEKLKNDLQQLKTELQKSKETIARLQKSEEQMRER